jgi:hypothetical protein
VRRNRVGLRRRDLSTPRKIYDEGARATELREFIVATGLITGETPVIDGGYYIID